MKLLSLLSILLFVTSFTDQNIPVIHMIGDSTMANKPYSKGNPEKGWGQVFPLYFNEDIKIENYAVNGRSTKSFIDEGKWKAVEENFKKGDYLIIEFGHNDAKKEDPKRYAAAETDYYDNLKMFVLTARKYGVTPLLATPIVRREFNDEGKLVETHGLYPGVVRKLAVDLDVPLLDLHQKTRELLQEMGPERSKKLFLHLEPGEYPSLPDGEKDNTHLSGTGAFKVADLAIEEIRNVMPSLSVYMKK